MASEVRAGIRFERSRWSAVLVGPHGRVIDEHAEPFDVEHSTSNAFGWLAARTGSDLRSVTVDVSDLLRDKPASRVLVIRISPRPAIDSIHALSVAPELAHSVTRTVHVAGGHDMRGRSLVPFDVATLQRELAREEAPELVAAVTAVGSIANPDDEERAADVILAAFPTARISVSHDFYSNALRDRDFTATVNAGLLEAGEDLASMIENAARERMPGIPVFFALNDGGRAPIRLLGATPVHALHSARALHVQAARHLARVDDGDVVIIADDVAEIGHVHGGVPSTHTVIKRGREPGLASNTARIDRYSPTFFDDALRPAAVIDNRTPGAPLPLHAPAPDFVETADLVGLGAAAAPLSSWADYLGHATTSTELRAELRRTEEDLRSQTIYWGADPTSTRVVESSAYTLAYGSRNVVRIRVRVIGDWLDVADSERQVS